MADDYDPTQPTSSDMPTPATESQGNQSFSGKADDLDQQRSHSSVAQAPATDNGQVEEREG